MPELRVAGGSRQPDDREGSADDAGDREAPHREGGRWFARASGTHEWVRRDWQELKAYAKQMGKDPDSLVFGHCNFFHFVDAKKRDDALALQRKSFERVMGTRRSFEMLQKGYLLGTTSEIIDTLQGHIDAGCTYLVHRPHDGGPQAGGYPRQGKAPRLGANMKTLVDTVMPFNTGASFKVLKGQTIRAEAHYRRHGGLQPPQPERALRPGAHEGGAGQDLPLHRRSPALQAQQHHAHHHRQHLDRRQARSAEGDVQQVHVRPHAEPLFDTYRLAEVFGITREQLPPHGCYENITHGVKGYDIIPEDIPSPFNIFQDMEIDGKTGRMDMTNKMPDKPEHVDLRAEMDCRVGISACPWFGKGLPLHIVVDES